MGTNESETERNKAIIRRFVEEVQNNKNFVVYDELNDPDFVNLSAPPGVPPTAKVESCTSRPSPRRIRTRATRSTT